MNEFTVPLKRDRIVAALRDFVEAIDQRLPQMERLGEVRIARDAQTFRHQALARIDRLMGGLATDAEREAEYADAVIADDGGPLREADYD